MTDIRFGIRSRESTKTKMKTKAYWWNGQPNFGDRLTPLLLERFAGIKTQWADLSYSSIVCVGSILHHVPRNWPGVVVGTGRLRADLPLKLNSATRIVGLRGPLSANGVPGDYALGDPGILADELVGPQPRKHLLGLLPHWTDTTLTTNPTFANMDHIIIDPAGPPLEVLRQVGSCQRLVTSSLHGMILADAFGIPRRFETTSHFTNLDTLFKFKDYSASIKMPLKIGKMQEAHRGCVDDLKGQVIDMMESLK